MAGVAAAANFLDFWPLEKGAAQMSPMQDILPTAVGKQSRNLAKERALMSPMQEPRLWYTLRRFFVLSSAQTACWWTALQHATRAPAQRWFRQLLFYDARPSWNQDPEAIERYILRAMPASDIVEAIEALVEEGLLTRPEATGLEERVLQHVDAHGAWVP
jgi:hypothetical protein